MTMNKTVQQITERIQKRSELTRAGYLERIRQAQDKGISRAHLSCSNLAHVYAAATTSDKQTMKAERMPNIGIVTAYNDMLSAHQPFHDFPDLIKETARLAGATAQVAGGVPAMCDGVTQGQTGMELSLFSRDVIALAASVALSHNCYDGVVYLGVCDKIVPGLIIAALTFGHIPSIFLPAGPMTTGLSNDDKAQARKQFAKGEITREQLLEAEMQSYHGPGTCTFYGTANSNQMLMEIMGMHLPGATFINPDTPLREFLTMSGVNHLLKMITVNNNYTPVYKILDEKAFVNGIIGLHATGGSTNLVIHLIAMAAAAGIIITPEDFADLSKVTPLLAKVYPNGRFDINQYHAAGGLQLLFSELIDAGMLHTDVHTVAGFGLEKYRCEPKLSNANTVQWHEYKAKSLDNNIARSYSNPFQQTGGLVRLEGEIGEAVMKVSAIDEARYIVEAPAIVFHDQESVKAAFSKGELARDFICVVMYQGPKANGMPELHGLTPILSILQDRGFKVALLTDGRMSGASGKIPAAIHVTPEALENGPIARIQTGDVIRINAITGTIEVITDDDWLQRPIEDVDVEQYQHGTGRELFGLFRHNVSGSAYGASIFNRL